jgi:hypothetical protein
LAKDGTHLIIQPLGPPHAQTIMSHQTIEAITLSPWHPDEDIPHFESLLMRRVARTSPRRQAQWSIAWEQWSPGAPIPLAPWSGPSPAERMIYLEPELMGPDWRSFCQQIAKGQDAHREPSLSWLGAFWISLALEPDARAHLSSCPQAQARMDEIAFHIQRSAADPFPQAHTPALGLAKPMAAGLWKSNDPHGFLSMLGARSIDALGWPQQHQGWTQTWQATLADQMLAECLSPFFPRPSHRLGHPWIIPRLARVADALRRVGATPERCAASMGDAACIAWMSTRHPVSHAPEDHRSWRQACHACFGSDTDAFAQSLRFYGADKAAHALGPTIDETERALLCDMLAEPEALLEQAERGRL